MTEFPVQGGCHCRAVRYTQLAPAISVQHCHCSQCRKLYGQQSGTGAVIARAAIRIEGQSDLADYRSSKSFLTQFCRVCGCHLFAYEDSEPELMYFSPGTLDGGVHPGHPADRECHIYVGSKAEWERIMDDLPKYEESSHDELQTSLQREGR
jgi:hypothetical protein